MKESKKGVRCQAPGVSSATSNTSDTSFVIRHSSLNTCPHKQTERRTLAHYVTVEVTALFCKDCGKQLTKEQWEV
jgi:hypothetical protein